MKSFLPLAAFALLAFPALSAAQTAFGDQTLALVSIGDGSNAITNAGNQVTLRSFAKDGGTQLGSALLPVFLSANTSEGQLMSDGSDPRNLYFAGYSKADPFGSIAFTDGTNIPRRVTRFDTRTLGEASVDLGPNAYSSRTIFSAQVIGSSLLTAGVSASSSSTLGGVLMGTFADGGGALTQGASAGSTRLAKNLGGTIYYTDGSDIFTGQGNTGSIFGSGSGAGGGNLSGFLFTDPNTLYFSVFDGGAGLYRATRSSDGTFAPGARIYSGAGLLSLATDGTRLFATTDDVGAGNNSLLSFNLDGGSVTTLANAGANRAFRGVEVVPEPGSMLALGLGGLALLRRRKKSA